MQLAGEIENWVNANRDYILDNISGLVRINTVNMPPGGNEKPGQEYIYDIVSSYLPAEDIDLFEIDDVEGIRQNPYFFPTIDGVEKIYKNRPNLVARLKGSGQKKSLAFSGHIDTMPDYGKKWTVFEDPYSGNIKDGKLYGRGSVDMKAGTLAGFIALKCIKELKIKLKGDVFAESVVDEENGGVNGTIAARLRNPDIDFAIVPEISNLAAGIETFGGTDWKIDVSEKGVGGIGADVDLENPIYKLSKIALALEKYDTYIKSFKVPEAFNDEFKIKLLTYQFYSGGSNYLESGAVPTEGHIYFWLEAYSYMDEESYRKDFLDFMHKELGKYKEFQEKFPVIENVIRFLYGHKTDTNHPAMNSIRKAYKNLGIEYIEKGIPYGTDAFAFKKVSNTDVVVLGPSGANPHGIDEYVDIDSVFQLIKIMVLTAADYCL
ncbi:MAG: M20/M25/M40 family metallo-hydrolase [Actinobacteria bacterium]|nr:M20/M25/M40 family metallo-hydrolase [Actinomycetota bacterium]